MIYPTKSHAQTQNNTHSSRFPIPCPFQHHHHFDSQHSISHMHETNITQLLNDLKEHNLGLNNAGQLSLEC